jgi:hypothetical protein
VESILGIPTHPSFPFFHYNHLRVSSSSPDVRVFMFTEFDAAFIALCLEGFLYGKISVQCALTCALAKEVHLFPNLGLYSGIFAMYLQRPPKKSRTASIIFYALCVLYVLSTVNVVLDLVNNIIQAEEANNNSESIRKNIIFFISCAEDIRAN